MFADNQRISHRQMKRQIMLSFGGILLLFFSGEMAEGGRNAILGAFLGYGALLVYFFFLVRNASSFGEMSVSFEGTVKWLIYLIYGSFLVLTGGFLLETICQVSSRYLLPDINRNLLKILLLLTALLGMGSDTQKRGRMGEVSFPWMFWGFILLLIFAAMHMRVPDGSTLPPLEAGSLLAYGYRFFAVGAVISLFPFGCARTKGKGRQFGELGKCWLILTLLVTSAAVILLGTYGYPGVRAMELPILNLMSGTSIPGGFLERFDIIWMALLLFTLLFSLGSLMYYSVRLFLPRQTAKAKSGGEKKAARQILAAASFLMWAASVAQIKSVSIDTVYVRLLECFFAPLFVIMTPLAGWGHRRAGNEKEKREDHSGGAV